MFEACWMMTWTSKYVLMENSYCEKQNFYSSVQDQLICCGWRVWFFVLHDTRKNRSMQWSDFFIDYVLIFLHIGAFLILTQYIKITGRKKQYKMFLVPPPPTPRPPRLFALCFLSSSQRKRRNGSREGVVPQPYQEFVLLVLRGRAASTVLVSAVLLNKL